MIRDLVLLARRWRVGRTLAVLALAWTALWFLEPPLRVPGREHVVAVVWPLVVALPVAASLDSASLFAEPIEILARRSLLLRKVAHVLLTALVVGLLAVTAPGATDGGILARNGAFLAGLGYLLAVVAPRPVGAIAVILLPAAMWILGSRGPGLPPAWWAVLLQGTGSRSASVAAVVVAGLGAATFVGTAERP